jgi:hypothetical protein
VTPALAQPVWQFALKSNEADGDARRYIKPYIDRTIVSGSPSAAGGVGRGHRERCALPSHHVFKKNTVFVYQNTSHRLSPVIKLARLSRHVHRETLLILTLLIRGG